MTFNRTYWKRHCWLRFKFHRWVDSGYNRAVHYHCEECGARWP